MLVLLEFGLVAYDINYIITGDQKALNPKNIRDIDKKQETNDKRQNMLMLYWYV